MRPHQQQMTSPNINVICWNVRGLNTLARRTTVHETLTSTTCHLANLQETKLSNVDQTLAYYLGGYNLCNFAQKPTTGMRGRILLLWNDDCVDVVDVHKSVFTLSTTITLK